MSDSTEAASSPVLAISGARATIRLNRPKHLNRLQPDDLEALLKLFGRLEADPALSCSTALVARSATELRS